MISGNTRNNGPGGKVAVRVLILGGTGEAHLLARELHKDGRFQVVTSLAGRTLSPAVPDGGLRVGGFGGAHGLQAFLVAHGIGILINATHPFASQISRNAVLAARAAKCRHYRLCRPPWSPVAGDVWLDADDAGHAAQKLRSGTVAFVTLGQRHLSPFAARRDVRILARMIEAPAKALPDHITVIQDRPPFSLPHECRTLASHGINVLVSRNAGGHAVAAKLTAARDMGVPVIMIRRPVMEASADAVSANDMLTLLEHDIT